MLKEQSFEALTNHGIHQLFNDNFEAMQFTLQIIHYRPSKEEPFTLILSDGYAWIKGQLVQQAKHYALRSADVKNYTLVKFKAQDITVDHSNHQFTLKHILEVRTTVHNLIGEPVPYTDYPKKGNHQATTQPVHIADNPSPAYSITNIKQLPVGKLTGAVVAKVVRKPDKVSSFMNIILQDQQGEEIQCCFFGAIADKYKDMIKIGAWYRFQDPVLQTNNRQQGALQLKINNHSNIQKIKPQPSQAPQTPKPQYALPQPITPDNKNNKKSGGGWFVQVQFKPDLSLQGQQQHSQVDYFVVARPLHIKPMKDGQSRIIQAVDRLGHPVEIALWKQFSQKEILIGETYRFGKMKIKSYQGQLSLHSDKIFTTISLSPQKILSKTQYINHQLPQHHNTLNTNKKERTLSNNEIVYSLSQVLQRSSQSKDRTLYLCTMGTLIVKFGYQNSNNTENNQIEFRKKLFYLSCELCQTDVSFPKPKIEPSLQNGVIVCSGCRKESGLKAMWNLKAVLGDEENQIPVKVNSEIVAKILSLEPIQGLDLCLKAPGVLRQRVMAALHMTKGVFKLSAKLNQKKVGQRFFNVCQYFGQCQSVDTGRAQRELRDAMATHSHFLKQQHPANPIPSFLSKQ